MRSNYDFQTNTYDGELHFSGNTYNAAGLTIPLYILAADTPVRKPKFTEIDTIPTNDEVHQSDWHTHMLFMGGQSALTTTIQGYLITPTKAIRDQRGQLYNQKDATGNGLFLGMSYGDIIWAYISGKVNQTNNIFLRQDPSMYFDPFGNQYNTIVVQQFQCDTTTWDHKETFQATLYLET